MFPLVGLVFPLREFGRVDETFESEELFVKAWPHSLLVVVCFDKFERFARQCNRPPSVCHALGDPLEGRGVSAESGQNEQDGRMVLDRTHNVLLGNVSTPLQTPRGPG